MKFLIFFVGLAAGLLLSPLVHWGHKQPRSRLFIADDFYRSSDGTVVSLAAFGRLEDIHQNCPETAFVSREEDADYSLTTVWDKDHWRAMLEGDGQFLVREYSPDFKKIERDACRTIQKNERWPARAAHAQAPKKSVPADRYELHDLRNGNVATSALIDRQTGKVWVWSTSGKGVTHFISEDVIPSPDSGTD